NCRPYDSHHKIESRLPDLPSVFSPFHPNCPPDHQNGSREEQPRLEGSVHVNGSEIVCSGNCKRDDEGDTYTKREPARSLGLRHVCVTSLSRYRSRPRWCSGTQAVPSWRATPATPALQVCWQRRLLISPHAGGAP